MTLHATRVTNLTASPLAKYLANQQALSQTKVLSETSARPVISPSAIWAASTHGGSFQITFLTKKSKPSIKSGGLHIRRSRLSGTRSIEQRGMQHISVAKL